MTSFINNEQNEGFQHSNMPQMKCLPLQEYQQLCSDLDRFRRETMNLRQKLCHARKNLEDEKRKRRVIEHYKNLLISQINMTREILFYDREINLDEGIKEKLQFLNKPEIKFNNQIYNNLNVQDRQSDRDFTIITETDSTGSILSDLNCLSKSEDDLDMDIIIKLQKEKKWKKYKPNNEYCMNNIVYKQYNTLDKIAEFNSPDGVTMRIKPKDGKSSVPVKIQTASNKENIDSELLNAKTFVNHNFISKMIIKPETCVSCGKRMRFGKMALKCRDCPVICHTECKIQTISLLCTYGKSTLL
ncbi:rac GTPase-activating protein 1-like [Pogonomyrmex barbatus]|uniref:Rac GTPase-activating protein 1-like n=1 Tax=Pogonomyrmex barbatus TaxID=144034 RepID=A0A6I9VVY1_9HYME|nr:rac GTPase-activating protein 1-like [Pogonomyrmex barbatus]